MVLLEAGDEDAWEKRGRMKELRSREASGPISFELRYREYRGSPVITYFLEIDEEGGRPVVRHETLRWRRGSHGKPFNFLNFDRGRGQVVSGDLPEEDDERRDATLASPDLLAVSTLGQLAENPRVVALRQFIEGWYLSYLSATDARGVPDAGPMERLSPSGDNLSNVVQYLGESHPERLQEILRTLSQRVPRLEQVTAEAMPDGRLLLRIKDAPFAEPFLARFASDGTLKMLAYLILLYDPDPLPLLGIEEPENYLHPRPAARAGGGVSQGLGGLAGGGLDAFTVLRGRAAPQGALGVRARRRGLHARDTSCRHARRRGFHRRGRSARRAMDGRSSRRR